MYKTHAEIKSEVLRVLSETVNLTSNMDIEAADLLNMGIDSISFINIVIALEDAFDIEFDDEMLNYKEFNNITSIIEYIFQKIKSEI